MTLQTADELLSIPGVVRVLSATPATGHVTLLVDASWPDERLGMIHDGHGRDEFPIGMIVHAERAGA